MAGNNQQGNSKIYNNNSVCVAVRIRPQSARERAASSNKVLLVTPNEPQMTIGDKAFTYDHVFDENTSQEIIYDLCIRDLVDGAFDGYNATVLAYGQTGSGKTYTMGTGFDEQLLQQGAKHLVGIVPRAAEHFFLGIEERKRAAKESGLLEPTFEVGIQFVELYNEEIIDLLADDRLNRPTAIKIHEDPTHNGICLSGVVSLPVQSASDVLEVLRAGALRRTTAATNMNQQSSRSHAIFTLMVKQSRVVTLEQESLSIDNGPSTELEMLHAKFHFVDLAGSERLKRTGATGDRAREGISINSGLLALGNVISALGGGSGRVLHVPYRDSKLTRLLQDSLGGNSRTLMIACASPSDVDFVETLNTLNYANRAKNIKNKVVANQDKSSKVILELKNRVALLEAELNDYKQGKKLIGDDGAEIFDEHYLENVELQAEVGRLRNRVKVLEQTVEMMQERIFQYRLQQETVEMGKADGQTEQHDQQFQKVVAGYLQELEQLRTQLIELQAANEQLRNQNSRFWTQLNRVGMVNHSSMDTSFSPFAHPLTNKSSVSMLIQSARKDIAEKRRALDFAHQDGLSGHDVNGEEERQGDVNMDGNELGEEMMDGEEFDQSDEVEDEEDEDNMEEDLAEKLSLERNRICGDLAALQEDINIKERLVAELEHVQRRLDQMRQEYERKLSELGLRITTTETERDQILEQMTGKKQTKQQKEEIQKVRDQYEKKLADMRSEHRRLELAERENKKRQKEQSRQQDEVNKIRNDLDSMKKQKVDLMKQLKEENKRIRELERENAKKVANFEKVQRQQQSRIQKLEHEAAMKAETLKRKTEEVQRLRKEKKDMQLRRRTIFEEKQQQQRAISAAKRDIGGRMGTEKPDPNATFVVEKPVAALIPVIKEDEESSVNQQGESENVPPHNLLVTPTQPKNRRLTFVKTPMPWHNTAFIQHTPARTKRNWTSIARAIETLVNKRHVISKMEQGMNRKMDERIDLMEDLARLESVYAISTSPNERATILEQRESVQTKLDYISDEIVRAQQAIVEVDRQKVDSPSEQLTPDDNFDHQQEGVDDLESLMMRFKRNYNIGTDVEYAVRHLLQLSVEKGVEAARLQSENKELNILREIGVEVIAPLRHPNYKQPQQENGQKMQQEDIQLDQNVTTQIPSTWTENSGTSQAMVTSSKADEERVKLIREISETDSKQKKRRSPQFELINAAEQVQSRYLQKHCRAVAHSKAIMSLHATESRLITGSKDRSAIIWDLESCSHICTLGNHLNSVKFVHLLPDDRTALSTTLNVVKVWDLRSGLCTRHLSSMGLVGQGTNEKVDRTTDIPPTETQIIGCAVDPNEGFLFTTSRNGVRIWDLARLEYIGIVGGREPSDQQFNRLAVFFETGSPGSNTTMQMAVSSVDSGQVNVYSQVQSQRKAFGSPRSTVHYGHCIELKPPHKDEVSALLYTDRALFTASKDLELMKFSTLDMKRDHSVPDAHDKFITAMSMVNPLGTGQTDDSSLLVTGCRGGTLKLWDIASSNQIHLLDTIEQAHPKSINDICANSQLLFTAGNDDKNSAIFWRISD